jgi:hypothetical protein
MIETRAYVTDEAPFLALAQGEHQCSETRSRPSGGCKAGNDDLLAINVWKEPDLTLDVTVRPDGMITVPLLGDVAASGRTPAGLAVRMVGENPAAVEGQGISVTAVRIGAIVAGSALMGVAGAFLTLSAFNAFFFNMVNGRGWICVALVVFASWRPGKALVGAILFAAFDALQLRLQQSSGGVLPYQLYLMLPYVLSILALALVARKAAYPQALMKPYRKGELNMYAVKMKGTCIVRYVELAGRNLVLRPHNQTYAVEVVPLSEGEGFTDHLVGRVCHMGIEV